MAESPITDAQGTVRVSVFSDGTRLGDDARLLSVTVERAVNRLPSARLVFVDGDMAESAFPLSDQPALIPGAALRITAGYGDDEQTLFDGIVCRPMCRPRRCCTKAWFSTASATGTSSSRAPPPTACSSSPME